MRAPARGGTLIVMTTNDAFGGWPPPPPSPAAGPQSPSTAGSGRRVLRRNRSGRVAAGVASGLGDYFGFDPVLFRVLFATSAFFGGAGILAYLLAWAAIPEAGTERAPIDGWVAALRRRRVPVWIVAVVVGILLWSVAFSWWAPNLFLPVVAVVLLLVIGFGRRDLQPDGPPPPGAPVSLVKGGAPAGDRPEWVGDARAWLDESRAAGRERRRRRRPVRIATLATLAAALVVLAVVDAISGVPLALYFWIPLGIVVAGLLVGLVTRRTPYGLALLLVPALAGAIAFGGSHASLSDGVGQRQWQPLDAPEAQYRLAFGQGVLDLRSLAAQSQPRTVEVTMGAGELEIIAPRSLDLTVLANIHLGQLDVDHDFGGGEHGGVGLSRRVDPPAGARGVPITVDAHLADGRISVVHK